MATPEQLHKVLMDCVNRARNVLEHAGTFYPLGSEIRADGQLNGVAGHNGEEHPNPADLYKLLADSFLAKARSGEVIAAGLAANADIPAELEDPTRDGIRVWLEGLGFSRYVYFPYRTEKGGFFRKGFTVNLYEPFSVELAAGWFPAVATPSTSLGRTREE